MILSSYACKSYQVNNRKEEVATLFKTPRHEPIRVEDGVMDSSTGERRGYSGGEALLLHLLPPLALLLGLWILPHHYGLNLVDHPAHTLRIAGVLQVIFSIFLYTLVSVNQKRCPSILQAVWRSIFALPIGAALLIIVALIFGAPLDFELSRKTAYWGQLTSALVVVPAGILLGGSWLEWQRLFAFTRPRGALEFSICIPAHGAVVGAWFGAWPMPLDWERPWQEWPVSVTYGMAGGFIVGEVISAFLLLCSGKRNKGKLD